MTQQDTGNARGREQSLTHGTQGFAVRHPAPARDAVRDLPRKPPSLLHHLNWPHRGRHY